VAPSSSATPVGPASARTAPSGDQAAAPPAGVSRTGPSSKVVAGVGEGTSTKEAASGVRAGREEERRGEEEGGSAIETSKKKKRCARACVPLQWRLHFITKHTHSGCEWLGDPALCVCVCVCAYVRVCVWCGRRR